MTLQNRVLPDGSIVAHPARGTLTGNRGILHGADRTLGAARWRHPNWVCCELSFKDRHRTVMSPGSWTELFFLDEAVALAAGHRPCAYCRRADYKAFLRAWASAFGVAPRASEIDRRLHAARILPGTRRQRSHEAEARELPPGVFVLIDDRFLLLADDCALPFSPVGYGAPVTRPAGRVMVLTPKPVVPVLRAGYRPRMHNSAEGLCG
jgi:hypothetical protein